MYQIMRGTACRPWQTLLLSLLFCIQIFVLGASPAAATSLYEMPSLAAGSSTWVVDEGEVLSRLTEGNLSEQLSQLADTTGQEVRLVTIHRLDYGETVETFTEKLFESWYPTADAQTNQALLVLDTVTNNAALHTGVETKSILPDDLATSVVGETLMAPLRDGNRYNQAFLDASDRLVAVLSGEPDPGPPELIVTEQAESTFASREETEESKGISTVWVIGLLLAATIIPMATYYFYQGFS